MFFSSYIQHCFICRPSDSTVSTDAGIEPRTVALVHWQSDALTTDHIRPRSNPYYISRKSETAMDRSGGALYFLGCRIAYKGAMDGARGG
jgi:hypothetical protein